MKYYNVGLDEVLKVCRDMNRNANGGVLYEFENEYIINGLLSTARAEELAKGVVKTVDGTPFYWRILRRSEDSREESEIGRRFRERKTRCTDHRHQTAQHEHHRPDKQTDATVKDLRRTCRLTFMSQLIRSVRAASSTALPLTM